MRSDSQNNLAFALCWLKRNVENFIESLTWDANAPNVAHSLRVLSKALSTASLETRMRMRHFLCETCPQTCEETNDVRLEPPERPPTASTDNIGRKVRSVDHGWIGFLRLLWGAIAR